MEGASTGGAADVHDPGEVERIVELLEQAIERGCSVQVLMGDARLRMNLPYKNHYTDETDHGGGLDDPGESPSQ